MSLSTTLKTLTGRETISTDAIKEYFKPLTDWMTSYLEANES